MTRRIWILFTVAAAVLLLMLTGCGGSESIDAYTFDFHELSTGGLPLGWSVVSYENAYAANCKDGVVTLSSTVADDLRLVYTVPVSGGKKYVLSADIATENVTGGEGATLSVDNYNADGSYIYSKGLFGTNGSTHVELAFETDKSQSEVRLALRLGGYSSVSSGAASYSNVSFAATDTASVSFQKLVPQKSSADKTEKSDSEYEAFFSLIRWMTILCAAFLLLGVYRHREQLESLETDGTKRRVRFLIIVLIGFFVRLFLCGVFKGHATDMGCWIGWGNQIADGQLSAFYDGTWYDYPPGYMLVLGLLTHIMRLLRVSQWGSETLRLFWYMLPPFLCDIGCGVLLMRFAKECGRTDAEALLLGALAVLNPAAVYLSGAWGQIDSVLTLLLLLSFAAFRRNRRILCAVWYALAVLVKWQALIYGPVIAMAYLFTLGEKKEKADFWRGLLKTAAAVLLALLIIFAVSVPFRGTMGTFWIVSRFLSASTGYDYATVEGYNFFALLGANWTKAGQDLFSGRTAGEALLFTGNTLGTLIALLGAAVLALNTVREFRGNRPRTAWLPLLSAGMICAVMHVFKFVVPEMENVSRLVYGAVFLIALISWFLQRTEAEGGFRSLLARDETAYFALLTAALSAGALTGTYLIWLILRLIGLSLTFKIFGSVMIFLSALAALWMLVRYHKAGRLKEDDPELLYLVSACFMLWVFTFAQYMHERYVFPVLFLLLFAYAAGRDRRILLCALLLTVTTFMNEVVAMYVVSEGAIHAIRGGNTHNAFISACSAGEVLTALYLTAVTYRHMTGLKKGGRDE